MKELTSFHLDLKPFTFNVASHNLCDDPAESLFSRVRGFATSEIGREVGEQSTTETSCDPEVAPAGRSVNERQEATLPLDTNMGARGGWGVEASSLLVDATDSGSFPTIGGISTSVLTSGGRA